MKKVSTKVNISPKRNTYRAWFQVFFQQKVAQAVFTSSSASW